MIKSLPTGSPLLTRLRELGLLPGTAVRLVRRAPMGDPIQICLRGSHLSLRQREAEQVEITVE